MKTTCHERGKQITKIEHTIEEGRCHITYLSRIIFVLSLKNLDEFWENRNHCWRKIKANKESAQSDKEQGVGEV